MHTCFLWRVSWPFWASSWDPGRFILREKKHLSLWQRLPSLMSRKELLTPGRENTFDVVRTVYIRAVYGGRLPRRAQ